MIPFNKPFLTGKEAHYLYEAVYKNGHISGNGEFTKRCQAFFEERYHFKKCLLTTSCTDALEMTSLLINIQPGDEVIIPSFTFVSTALAYVRQGAIVKFLDSHSTHPGMDEDKIEQLITKKTKAIIVVHYAGLACDMDKIMQLANKYNLFVIEDAAQAIDSFYKNKPLGGIGHFGCFSFHETKNIQCGEGGMLVINDERFIERAEILWEKGTNRAKFFRGEIDKYGWVDIGSSFLPSELNASYLWAQLENLDQIQSKRKNTWENYYEGLQELKAKNIIELPFINEYATNNGHLFYVVLQNIDIRDKVIQMLKKEGIHCVFHYQSLHNSNYYQSKYPVEKLENAEKYSNQLLRLPLYYELDLQNQSKIISNLKKLITSF